jgi:hypothetical protein
MFKRTLSICALALLTQQAAAQELPCPSEFSRGTNTLFIGHSFFVPIANQFNTIAQRNGYVDHAFDTYFSGGASGGPDALWDSPTAFPIINAKLETGDVELFGMTVGEQSDPEVYAHWIELARSYNPDTTFFIGHPWVPGGPSMTSETFEFLNQNIADSIFDTVQELRRMFPQTQIEYISYAHTISIMRNMLEAGELPDLDCLEGCGPGSFFTDPGLGHANPMLQEVAALSWMQILYGADTDMLEFTEYESDIPSIIEGAYQANYAYQTLPQDLNNNGQVNFFDVSAFLVAYAAQAPIADFYPDGQFDFFDVSRFISAYNRGCP